MGFDATNSDAYCRSGTAMLRPSLSCFALFLLVAGPAMADDAAACRSNTPDAAACTRLIESGALQGADLVAVHIKRAEAHFRKGAYAEAIPDFDEIIRLDPDHALAYKGRAL